VNVVRARADVVATKLGIIVPSSSFLPCTFYQKGLTYDFEFVHAFLGNKKNKIEPKNHGWVDPPVHPPNRHSWVDSRRSACAMGKWATPSVHAYPFFLSVEIRTAHICLHLTQLNCPYCVHRKKETQQIIHKIKLSAFWKVIVEQVQTKVKKIRSFSPGILIPMKYQGSWSNGSISLKLGKSTRQINHLICKTQNIKHFFLGKLS